MGFPAIYSSDQGREFVNSVMSSLIEKTNAVHRISTAYHPQTNGLVERFNQTIQQMILKICNEDQNDWDIFLPELLFSYRTMVHKTTKQTPFSVMFEDHFLE
jgi:transposase InsO family protein